MELKFQIPTRAYYLEGSDEYEYDYKEVKFYPSNDKLNECVATCIFDEYFEKGLFNRTEQIKIIDYIKEFIREKRLTEKLARDEYDIQVYDWFEKEAFENYK